MKTKIGGKLSWKIGEDWKKLVLKDQYNFNLFTIIFFISALTVEMTLLLIFCFALSIQFSKRALELNSLKNFFKEGAHFFLFKYNLFIYPKHHNYSIGSRLPTWTKQGRIKFFHSVSPTIDFHYQLVFALTAKVWFYFLNLLTFNYKLDNTNDEKGI